MKQVVSLTIAIFATNALFSSQKLTVANDTARMIHVVYVHEKSPKKYLPDEIAVFSNKLRRLPNTKTNPESIAFRVDGKLLNDGIGLAPECKSLIINEYVKGKLVISHSGGIVAEIQVK